MKLNHPKSWYERSADLEGNSEVGAGIPPGSRVQTARGSVIVASGVPTAFFNHKLREKPVLSKPHTVRVAAKAVCHK
jgi:hypothetical protein